ncbi:hypothetical protein Cfor_05094 [Coptotermes formosanus]|uniref:RING-type E3 ubiquitin transferase n=1 Tax=Coptotermes formosanus TaxID=36987 RepID=A0A6L2PWX5_COPFO|nr:hypothetical protein Cfor_05094 [Coptotermes formosanus]
MNRQAEREDLLQLLLRTSPQVYLEIMSKYVLCPVCKKCPNGPTVRCTEGHNLCFVCRAKYAKCPSCGTDFVGPRKLDEIKNALPEKHPCTNKTRGCDMTLPKFLIKDHEETCPHKPVRCPLKEVPGMYCKWQGLLQNLKDHVKDKHHTLLVEQQFVRFSTESNVNIVISNYGDEVFIFYRKRRNGKYCGVVQRVGLSRRLYTCQVIFKSPDGISTIVFTFVIPTMRRSLVSLLKSGGCFKLNESVLRNFYWENGVEALVNINDDVGKHVS